MDERSVVRCGARSHDLAARDYHDRRVVRRSEKDLVGLCREAQRGGITRRQFIERALVVGLSATAVGALASACGDEGPSPSPTGTLPPMDETKPAEILFHNWTDYIDPAILRGFRRETGVRVELDRDWGASSSPSSKSAPRATTWSVSPTSW